MPHPDSVASGATGEQENDVTAEGASEQGLGAKTAEGVARRVRRSRRRVRRKDRGQNRTGEGTYSEIPGISSEPERTPEAVDLPTDQKRCIMSNGLESVMSGDYEESPYEDDEEVVTSPVEILPPVKAKRPWDWKDFLMWGLVGLIAWHVVDRLVDRFGNSASAQPTKVVSAPTNHESSETRLRWKSGGYYRDATTTRAVERMVDESERNCWRTRVHSWCPPEKPGCIYDYNVCTGEIQ